MSLVWYQDKDKTLIEETHQTQPHCVREEEMLHYGFYQKFLVGDIVTNLKWSISALSGPIWVCEDIFW